MPLIKPSEVVGYEPRRGGAGGAKSVPRDHNDRPLIHVPEQCPLCKEDPKATDHKLVPYTRTTTYIDCIEDKSGLDKWGKRMVVVGGSRAIPELEAARELDPVDDKGKLDKVAKKLVAIGGAHEKREKGSELHELSEYVDRREPMPAASEADVADMAGYKWATLDLDIMHIEQLVVCDCLSVGGTPDRIVWYDGPGPGAGLETMSARMRKSRGVEYAPAWIKGPLIADLKTGTLDYGALKHAMQLAIYSRAVFYDPETRERTPLPPVNQDWGVIINLPAGTGVAELFWINLRVGWEGALLAKQVRTFRNQGGKVLVPFAPPSPQTASVNAVEVSGPEREGM